MANAKYKIKGNNKIHGYDSEIEVEVDDRYEAYSKEIPEPTPYKDFIITWFNSFGVREKASGKDANIFYTVKLKKLPKGKRLFALYGGEIHELTTEEAGNGNVKFTLNVGDPPLGGGP